MLNFLRDQLLSLEEIEMGRFQEKLFKRFRTEFHKQSLHHSDQKLKEIIRDSTEVGIKIGLKSEGPLSQFVGISVMLCEKFYDQTEIKSLLHYSGFTADDKISLLIDKLHDILRK